MFEKPQIHGKTLKEMPCEERTERPRSTSACKKHEGEEAMLKVDLPASVTSVGVVDQLWMDQR